MNLLPHLPDALHHAGEQAVTRVFPSVAALLPGRVLGALYESVPLQIGTLKLSYIFALLTAPLALPLYFWQKAFGQRYLLTNQRLRIVTGLSGKPRGEVTLDEIGRVEIASTFGQKFYKAGDLVVRDHLGNERLRLEGVVRPEMFRRTILETRDAVVRTEAAIQQIGSRAVTSRRQ